MVDLRRSGEGNGRLMLRREWFFLTMLMSFRERRECLMSREWKGHDWARKELRAYFSNAMKVARMARKDLKLHANAVPMQEVAEALN